MLRLWQAVPLSIALGILSLWLVLPNLSLSDVRTALRTVDLRLVPAILGTVASWWLFAGLRTLILSARVGTRISLLRAMQTHVFGVFSSSVTPAGAGSSFGIAFLLMRFGLSAENATAVAVMTIVGDLTFFAWSVPTSFVLLTRMGLNLPIENLPLYTLSLSVLAFGASYVLVFRLPLTTRIIARLVRFRLLRRFQSRISLFLQELSLASERYSKMPWTWHLGFVALSSLTRILYFTTFNLIILALGLDISQVAIYAFQAVIHSFAFAIPTPGASGYQEVAMSYALMSQTPSKSLSAAILLWRLCNHYLYFLVGPLVGGLALMTPRLSQRPVDEPKAEPGDRDLP